MNATVYNYYSAFRKLNADAMINCYSNSIIYKDPLFGILQSEDVFIKTKMLCDILRNSEFKLKLISNSKIEDVIVVHWEADLLFGKKKREIICQIKSEFIVERETITSHTDDFSINNLAVQATGLKGSIVGSTSFFKRKLLDKSQALFNRYERVYRNAFLTENH